MRRALRRLINIATLLIVWITAFSAGCSAPIPEMHLAIANPAAEVVSGTADGRSCAGTTDGVLTSLAGATTLRLTARIRGAQEVRLCDSVAPVTDSPTLA